MIIIQNNKMKLMILNNKFKKTNQKHKRLNQALQRNLKVILLRLSNLKMTIPIRMNLHPIQPLLYRKIILINKQYHYYNS